ncbi:MAG: hypothetical protein EZS28_021320 [Streblomastix strix]|uniref:Uncharacterized protein n=1 Tax=Streblomastix strix TaxID=222440 RepID=A0A5J4VLQ4_9EUKA|nr:MAG: hypothetical protein EZS28_021320 [Streblomastix strix]
MSTTPTSSVINSFQKSELKITTLSDEMCHVGSQLSQFFWIAQPATVEIVGKSGSFKTAVFVIIYINEFIQQLGFVCVDGIDGFLERGVVEGFDNRTSSLYQVSQALNILASHSFCRVVITNHTVEDNKRAKVLKKDTQKRIGESYNIDRFSFQEKDLQTQKNENDENDQETINDGQFNTLLLRNKLGVLWEGAVQERITILNAQTTQRNFPIQVPLVGKFMLDYPCY